ncbi:alcohol dehydrogenase catalytic domain-containing protein [Bacillus sp. FJAT-50079]|uniref:zinc-dependent alcohol dehydrogenase n=1 Tax=Bacillus sp. FJAT-50079 TaxID=2833577 RepID=UPI001BCA0063|nr:alcohol dehydrogenase catalytic domain-containing protein [Bacillus sp. FJAT-50079]MBS4208144.1 alcohol dehydrogenase catalytic domain-containing protein [Bacillus sp. FJAT-50079]
MKAGQYLAEKNISINEIQKPTVQSGEALIKVLCAGLCGTDMMIYFGKHPRAKAPLAMGHEFSGVIEEISGDSLFKIGDRVVVEPTISCGNCSACISGQNHVCESLQLIGIDMDGGFAEYVVVPIDRLHKTPDHLSDSIASLAEPVAVAVHTVRKSKLKIGQDIAILGAGPIGLLIGLIAKLNGANTIFISDISPYRLKVAKELGFHVLDANRISITEEILNRTNERGVDVVFEVAGTQTTAEQMIDIIKTQGEIVVVSVFKQPPTLNLAKMHYREISLTTTRCYSSDDFKTAIDLLAQGNLHVSPIISHELSLDEINKGFLLMENPETSLKVLIKP